MAKMGPMQNDHGWHVGDRVSLCPTGRESDRVTATVTAVDEPGRPRGVRVQLDHLVRGRSSRRSAGSRLHAYASHDELTLIERAASD